MLSKFDPGQLPFKLLLSLVIAATWVVIIGIAVFAMFTEDSPGNRSTTTSTAQQQQTDFTVSAKPLPDTGYGYENDEAKVYRGNYLVIKTKNTGIHTWINVEDWDSEKFILARFIRSGDRLKIALPQGTYRVRTASGKTWYGDKELFGPKTSYSSMGDPFPLTRPYSWWEVELILQQDGNLR